MRTKIRFSLDFITIERITIIDAHLYVLPSKAGSHTLILRTLEFKSATIKQNTRRVLSVVPSSRTHIFSGFVPSVVVHSLTLYSGDNACSSLVVPRESLV